MPSVNNTPMHIHPRVTIYVDGQQAIVPANVGISPALHAGHKYDKYTGGHGPAPIHTHTADGVLHVESNITRKWTLANFFYIWGVSLEGLKVDVTVDGKARKDYRRVVLKDGSDIVLNVRTK